MKKLSTLLCLIAVATILLVSCGQDNDAELAALRAELNELRDTTIEPTQQIETTTQELTTIEETTMPTTVEITTELTTEPITEPPIQIPENPDFRNIVWGMPSEYIISLETAEFVDNDDTVHLFRGRIIELPCDIIYFHTKEIGIYRGAITFTENHRNSPQRYLSNFDRIKEALITVYGEPQEDVRLVLNTLDRVSSPSDSIRMGYSMYRVIWETETTVIMLGMMRQDRDVMTMIDYRSIELTPEQDLSGF